jgi:hypothetical protein
MTYYLFICSTYEGRAMRDEEDGWWDIAQICLNGHMVNQRVIEQRDHSQPFCDRCGKPTIMACRRCSAPIRGVYHSPGSYVVDPIELPIYCLGCGSPYPWTERRINAAKELAAEIETLKPHERELLKRSIDDLLTDTPRTQLAVVRFKRLAAKAGEDARLGLREILVSLASEAVRRAVWGA